MEKQKILEILYDVYCQELKPKKAIEVIFNQEDLSEFITDFMNWYNNNCVIEVPVSKVMIESYVKNEIINK